ncbi:hypothetical protein MNB_SV-12-1638 [hydrothermal vent metagenome]|uniref:Uncharacterized protein n=1 Tax=hydrothermal vent metagenome TaxID=652676 RepID=A0A1W1CH18_9ZZZZ
MENGFFETISVLLLFAIFLYGVLCSIRSRDRFSRLTLFFILSFSLLAFLGAMEEISWGQQIFHFKSSEYFLEHNLQHETNLHNLIDANLFSSIIYSSIYTLFVFIPLLYKLFKSHLERFSLLKYFDINPHTILVVLFASVFQLYFYNDIGIVVDALTHIVALMLFGYFLVTKRSDRWLRIHFIFIVFATIVSAYHYKAYSFFNMQYEIRESFVVLSALLIFIELIKKEKNEKSSLDN